MAGDSVDVQNVTLDALQEDPSKMMSQAFEGVEMFTRDMGHMVAGPGMRDHGGFQDSGYGGRQGRSAGGLQELMLCECWRPMGYGPPKIAKGVVHRIHMEDHTVTVQFLDDQHRLRLKSSMVNPISPVEPKYPRVVLQKGERPPTRAEIMEKINREAAEEEWASLNGVALPPKPAQSDEADPSDNTERRVERVDQWGIPAPTLDALRNRSVPSYQVSGVYGEHFYSKLYASNFHSTKDKQIQQEAAAAANGVVGGRPGSLGGRPGGVPANGAAPLPQAGGGGRGGPSTIKTHRYIPLEGPEMEQMPDGSWRDIQEEHHTLFGSIAAAVF